MPQLHVHTTSEPTSARLLVTSQGATLHDGRTLGECSIHTDPDHDGSHVRAQHTHTGLDVTISRNSDGQPTVTIDTESAPDDDCTPDGLPILQVLVNDGAVYDVDPSDSRTIGAGNTRADVVEIATRADGAFNTDECCSIATAFRHGTPVALLRDANGDAIAELTSLTVPRHVYTAIKPIARDRSNEPGRITIHGPIPGPVSVGPIPGPRLNAIALDLDHVQADRREELRSAMNEATAQLIEARSHCAPHMHGSPMLSWLGALTTTVLRTVDYIDDAR